MMVKVNSRQCDDFVATVTLIIILHFFIFQTWKTNVYYFDIGSSAHTHLYCEKKQSSKMLFSTVANHLALVAMETYILEPYISLVLALVNPVGIILNF